MTVNTFPKPKIVVSKCLEFDKCRYNGQMIPAKFVRNLQSFVDFIPICPEVEIGLGIPRDPIKLVEEKNQMKLVQPSTNRDLTLPMKKYSESFLGSLKDVDGFILKFGSPSCGTTNVKIFHKMDNPIAKRKGVGMFADEVLKRFSGLAIEDEGRLTNFRIREHFLTKIFLFANFRKVKKSKAISSLVKFQTQNKLLFMAYNQKHMRLMGQIVANIKKDNFDEMIENYQGHLQETFKRNAKYTSHINVLMHALGYFKDDLEAKEKRYFLNMLEKYKNETVPLSAVLSVLQSWIIKYEKSYLHQQTYFEPYPDKLMEITDSGKGRNGK